MNTNILHIPASSKGKHLACRVTQVGKLHKSKRIVKIAGIRENLEVSFMALAASRPSDIDRALRAEAQRNARRAKR